MGRKGVSLTLVFVLALVVLFPYAVFVRVHQQNAGTFFSAQNPLVSTELHSVQHNDLGLELMHVINQAQVVLAQSKGVFTVVHPSPQSSMSHNVDVLVSRSAVPSHAANISQHSKKQKVPGNRDNREYDVNLDFDVRKRERSTQDLVVGLGTGITPENLAVFAGSLRSVNSGCMLVLYLDAPLPKIHREIVEKFNVTAVEFAVDLLEPDFLRQYHPSNYRWPLLYLFLKEKSKNFGKVLMADVRDTMFQTDPFAKFDVGFFAFNGVAHDPVSNWIIVHPSESRTIAECGWNGGWVKDCFGPEMLAKIGKKPIICSGISMGSTTEVVEYLRLMSETMTTAKFADCERNGVDQGVHNVLVHTDMIPGLLVEDQTTGWVANMQSGRSKISGDMVLNPRGNKVAVVHQYDRFKDLQASYFKRFVFWPLPSEAETCAAFVVTHDAELFKKTCDLKVTSGHSAGHCCQSCERTERCQAFSFAGSQCFLKSCKTSQKSLPMKGVTSGFISTPK